VPGRLANDASALFARNLFNFISPHVDSESKVLSIDWEDDTIKGTCVARDGKVIHPMLGSKKMPAKNVPEETDTAENNQSASKGK
jgi:hypothetical protein